LLAALPVNADQIRIATYHTELSRDGPGLLLRDILRGDDAQIANVVQIIVTASADVLLVQGFDHDLEQHALTAFADALSRAGIDYPYRVSLPPNTGVPTGLDIDGDGRLGRARDAQGYGRFTGQGGMAVLSRLPIGEVFDHSGFLWRDLPNGRAADVLPPAAPAVQRLASVAAWDVGIVTPQGALRLLTLHATPPVFDGPEDRNGHRNEDELWFWLNQIDGWSPDDTPPLNSRFLLMGVLNADPVDGEARRGALAAALSHPLLQDPAPTSEGAAEAGDATDTADWSDPDPGNLRASYVLPSADLRIIGTGVFWPESNSPDWALLGGEDGNGASRHRLVWLDIAIP
jgi:hypothetical protein